MIRSAGITAVLFDWGGTLTPWHEIDTWGELAALAQAVRTDDLNREELIDTLANAVATTWARSTSLQESSTVENLFTEAGLEHDPELLSGYYEFWGPHTLTDPAVRPTWEALRAEGIRIGVLSNTIWPRAFHEAIFERDGVLDLIDGAVYTSEIPWTKPSPRAFEAAMAAVGASDPSRCVYVGDRLFDDIWGAKNAGMRAVFVPHSAIPPEQVGHTEGTPDAVVEGLADLPEVLRAWL